MICDFKSAGMKFTYEYFSLEKWMASNIYLEKANNFIFKSFSFLSKIKL